MYRGKTQQLTFDLTRGDREPLGFALAAGAKVRRKFATFLFYCLYYEKQIIF